MPIIKIWTNSIQCTLARGEYRYYRIGIEVLFENMSQFLCSGGGDKKMAESKGSLLAKSVSKHAGRAKEKVKKDYFSHVLILKIQYKSMHPSFS